MKLNYKNDTNKSVITWKGYKVTGEHAGTLKVKSGDLNFTEGKLTVRNDRGFIVGDDLDLALSVSGETVLIATTKTANDLKIQLKDSSGVYTAQFFDNTNKRIGIYNEAPDDDFVIGTEADPKNLKVTGDLTVLGDRVALEIETLRVQDFQIELG